MHVKSEKLKSFWYRKKGNVKTEHGKSDERKGKNVERKSETKEGTEQKQKMNVFCLSFFLWFFTKREKDFKRNFKNSGKIKRIFCTRNVFIRREQKQKTKESFYHISRQKHILVFGYIKREKKERQSWKEE